jgi:hypothetical protein
MMSAEAFQSELSSSESLLWSGQPERRVIFHKEDLLFIPFSLMWGGFAMVWEIIALVMPHGHNILSWLFPVWGIPFLLVGQYIIWGRFIHVAWKKSRTFYAVTSQRILLRTVSTWSHNKFRMLDLSGVNEIERSIRSDGIGTLQFGRKPTTGSSGFTIDPLYRHGVPAFVDICDAEMVYHIILDAKERRYPRQMTASAFGFSRGN